MAVELQRILVDLGLGQYLPSCLRAGIQSWESLSTSTEAELIAIGVRAGHRRKLQRFIATAVHWPQNSPLPTAAELQRQRQRQDLRRLARGPADPEELEENYYALTSSAQSPWSAKTCFSDDTDDSHGENDDEGTCLQVAEVLRESSRLFPLAGHEQEDEKSRQQEKFERELRSLASRGLLFFEVTMPVTVPVTVPVPLAESASGPPYSDVLLSNDISSGRSPAAAIAAGLLLLGASAESMGVGPAPEPLETFVETFLQSFNHFLFFFSDFELWQCFSSREHTANTDLPIDMYLVLALGAKASVFQVEHLQNEWYRRARLHLLSKQYLHDLRMMRVLALICIFEIDDDIDVAARFLDAATNIGLAHGLDAQEPTQNGVKEPAHSQWLRVWETIRFLNLWFLLQPQAAGRQLSDSTRLIEIDQPALLSDYCYTGRLVQMSIGALSNHLREVIKDRRDSTKNSPSSLLYDAHLKGLDCWHAELPLHLCLRTPSLEDTRMVHPEATYHQMTAILNIQSLFLGIVCELLQPALMTVLRNQPSSSKNKLILDARRCIQSATILVRLCNEIVDANYPLSASWIAQYFLFNATLILITDVNRTDSALEEFTSPEEHLECIQIALDLLNHVSSGSPQVIIIRIFCRAAGLSDTMNLD